MTTTQATGESSGREWGIPSVPKCLVLLCVVRLCLRLRGIDRTIAFARRFAHAAIKTSAPTAAALPIAQRVAIAGALFPGRARCLEQSLSLYCLLIRRSVPCALRLGTQPYGFVAHAWVEVGGVPVNEELGLIRKLAPFPVVAS